MKANFFFLPEGNSALRNALKSFVLCSMDSSELPSAQTFTSPDGKHLRLASVNETLLQADQALAREALFFHRCGISKADLLAAIKQARNNATSLQAELIAARRIESRILYRFLAKQLLIAYLEDIDPGRIVRVGATDPLRAPDRPIMIMGEKGLVTVISPEVAKLDEEIARLSKYPASRQSLMIAAPETIRKALWLSRDGERVRETTRSLSESRSEDSAARVLTGGQGFALASLLACAVACSLTWPIATLLALHIVLTSFFMGANCLRLLAAFLGHRPAPPRLPVEPPSGLPVYTILIALKDEVETVPQLIAAIDRLKWPKSRLDIKFVCEANDSRTIAAIQRARPGPHCEIVLVPRHGPMTKPKALQYAFAGARGEFVAVYDAEDIPAPLQLLEAWTLFQREGPGLACVQAPLAVANLSKNWITGLFAIEYGGLFRGLVPFLDRFGLPVPLGGTSNHFRRSALEDVGGWDPYNVTEDADLGIRLHRRGYQTKAAFHATIEAAPDQIGVWTNQRSRWLKGWMQTWLVLMRSPWRAFTELGPIGFLTIQLMVGGMLLSTLFHPAMYAFIGFMIASFALDLPISDGAVVVTLMVVDVASILLTYASFALLGLVHLTPGERRRLNKRALFMLPIYWLAMSVAGWKALSELKSRAFYWAKTPHPNT